MTSKRSWHLVVLLCCGFSACSSVVSQDPKEAASVALKFARLTFVDHDYTSAYELLSPIATARMPKGEFVTAITVMHPKSFPTEVVATDYEFSSSKAGIVIYLKGTSASKDETFFYELGLNGDSTEGYQVNGFTRSEDDSHSKQKQPLDAGE